MPPSTSRPIRDSVSPYLGPPPFWAYFLFGEENDLTVRIVVTKTSVTSASVRARSIRMSSSVLRSPSIPRIAVLYPAQRRRSLKTPAKGQLNTETPVAQKPGGNGTVELRSWGEKNGKRLSV